MTTEQNNEWGDIPQGWEVVALGDLTTFINDGTHHTPKYTHLGIPFYSVENVTNNDFVNTKFISKEEHQRLIKRCNPEKGDILLTRIGTIGKTKLIDWDINASIYVSLALLKFKNFVNVSYIYEYSKSDLFLIEIFKKSLLNAVPPKINMDSISSIMIKIPKSTTEQTAIATVLSDTDKLIDSLTALIAKKQAIKSATMSQLLSGQKRLSEFANHSDGTPKTYIQTDNGKIPEDWEVMVIGGLVDTITAPKKLKTSSYKLSGKYPIIDQSQEYICGWTDDDESIINVTSPLIVFGDHTCISKLVTRSFAQGADGVKILQTKPCVTPDFLYQYLQYSPVTPEMYKRHFSKLKEKVIYTPKSPTEQTAIAQILSDMDSEIIALENRLNKTKALKQGLMHQLLTGKIRLI